MNHEEYSDLFIGFVRLHILHHAVHEEIFGLGMIEELNRHGYKLSAGTMYPMLHNMEKRGYLKSSEMAINGKLRRVYKATAKGKKALKAAKKQLKELVNEIDEK